MCQCVMSKCFEKDVRRATSVVLFARLLAEHIEGLRRSTKGHQWVSQERSECEGRASLTAELWPKWYDWSTEPDLST
jgi:hypothetical protein